MIRSKPAEHLTKLRSLLTYLLRRLAVANCTMPRKGPPKTTRRAVHDAERKSATSKRVSADMKSDRTAEELRKFDQNARPEMPILRADQKALRSGLEERGDKLLRFGDDGKKRGDVIEASTPLGAQCRGELRGDCYGSDDE